MQRVGVPEVSRVTRWAVLLALGTGTALMYVVSLRGNFLYGLSIGQTGDKAQLFAWANVAADLWKGFGLIAVALLWRTHKRMASLAALAWLACLATGVNSAIGIYVNDRNTLTGLQEARSSTYAETHQALAKIEDRIQRLGSQPSVAEVEATIAIEFAKPVVVSDRVRGTVGSISNNCSKHDARTITACVEVARLQQLLAMSNEMSSLQEEARRLRTRAQSLRDRGDSLSADPLGEFWSRATRGVLSVRDVSFGFPLAFALVIEIVSAFGPAVIVSFALATKRQSLLQPAPTGVSLQQPVAAGAWHVAVWLSERTVPTRAGSGLTTNDLHADYNIWCANMDTHAVGEREFSDELDRLCRLPELAAKIRKYGNRYYGLRLTARLLTLATKEKGEKASISDA